MDIVDLAQNITILILAIAIIITNKTIRGIIAMPKEKKSSKKKYNQWVEELIELRKQQEEQGMLFRKIDNQLQLIRNDILACGKLQWVAKLKWERANNYSASAYYNKKHKIMVTDNGRLTIKGVELYSESDFVKDSIYGVIEHYFHGYNGLATQGDDEQMRQIKAIVGLK